MQANRTTVVESPVWPPQSSHQALLSSPNGRRKFREMQDRRQIKSPSKAQQLLDEGLEDENDEEDEDEETLQLKLAAIEARLKLKKLQNKTKSGASGSDAEAGSSSRPLTRFRSERNQDEGVQVPLSPVKNPKPTLEPVSPRRVILGIDKGVKGRDVSLRRPPASRPESRVTGTLRRGPEATPAARRDEYRSSSSLGLPEGSQRPKSFSERIAESRSSDKSKRERAEELQRKRSTAFNLDKDEMAHFQATAAAAESKNHPSSEAQDRRHVEQFSRDDILRAQTPSTLRRNKTTSNLRGQSTDLRKPPDLQHSFDSSGDRQRETGPEDTGLKPPDATKYEPFSSLHLSNRVLPHSFLTRTLASKTTMRIPDLLKEVKGPSFDPPEVDGDYVVFGIVASKSSPKEHKNQKNVTAKEKDTNDDGSNNTSKYMAITLTDLQWTIDLFLFTTAFTRYYKLSPGTVIAILNPSIMPPPRGKEDTNRFSLTISSSDDTILEIGSSRDLGFCKTVRKDGKVCEAWIDARKTEFCDFHVDVQVRKTKSRRMEISGAGAELFGPGGRSGSRMGNFGGGGAKRNNNNKQGGFRDDGLLKHEGGATYDRATGSTYYVAPAAPSSYATGSNFARGRSAASLLDSDDPFIAEGALSRYEGSKQERMRKRLAEQERERNIARNLTGAGGSNTGGGVGAEYLRAGHGDPSSLSSGNTHPDQAGTSETTAANILDLGKGVRKAGSIKLGPRKRAHDGKEATVSKKTRFMTPKGIREAGRESLGGVPQRPVEEDDDDELDIV
ncbi:hypothetical protein FQN54_008496 [Arachnomyces sp. PD_36]|nr:hypothetical protein FQN54_008496 [Arachnomyces sp. PD_36]